MAESKKVKIKLDSQYIHSGVRYGPGEVEVPEKIVEDLEGAQERRKERNKKTQEKRNAILGNQAVPDANESKQPRQAQRQGQEPQKGNQGQGQGNQGGKK